MPNPTITPQNFTRGTSEMTLDQFNQQLRQSPLYATWMAQNGIRTDKPIKLSKQQQKAFAAYLTQNGVPVPKDFHIDEAGNFNQKSRLKRNLIIAGIGVGAAVGAPILLGALGGGAGAAGAAGVALPGSIGGGTVAALPGALGAGGGLAAGGAGAVTGASVAGAATAAAKSPSLWSKISGKDLLEVGVPAGAQVAGALIGANAQKAAAKMEADAAREALAWQKDVYAERQRQLAPAIGVGNGATMKLGDLMGIQAPAGGYQPNLPQTAQATQRQPTAATPGAAPAMVPMRAPTGQVSMVPQDQVSHYEQRGATRVV